VAVSDPLPPGPVPGVPEPPPRPPARKPSTVGGLVYLVVLAISAVGLGVVAFGPWRKGVALIGVGLVLAAAARLVLTELNAGMLLVRGKVFDVVALGGVGAVLILLAAVIPNQTS
jgi:hypothetical protein